MRLLLLITTLSFSLFVTGCPLLGCGAACDATLEPNVVLTAHLAIPTSALANATVTFCRNGDCATGAFGPVPAMLQLDGKAFPVTADLTDELDGWIEVTATPQPGSVPLNDGDVYRLAIVAADGTSLLDVTRPVTFDDVEVCGTNSKEADLELYPTSASNVSCDSQICTRAGVELGNDDLMTSDGATPFDVTVCRDGDVCASAPVVLTYLTAGGNVVGSLGGDFLGTVTVIEPELGTYAYDVQTIEDSAALTDGDTYTVTVAQGSTTLLASAPVTVTYDATYPNGPACDPVPCRTATVRVP